MNGLYVHIPFCSSKCIYCDFYSRPGQDRLFASVADAIAQEYILRRKEIAGDFDTVYFGGGTPSILPAEIFANLAGALPLATAKEVTIEVNPDDVTPEAVAAWRQAGVNRVSMGVQSLDNNILRWMRRRHDADTALGAIKTLQDGGISNISCDLIYGIPGMSSDGWKDSLNDLLDTGITHLSAYCLTYHEDTALANRLRRGLDIPPDDDIIASQFDTLKDITAKAGFEHYEISNFARPGFRSAHNCIYWQLDGRWLGLGPAAHSFDGTTRRIDIADISRWLEAFPQPWEVESESHLDILNDHIVSALRTVEGLDLAALPEGIVTSLLHDAAPFIAAGDMTYTNGRLAIRSEKWLVADSFIREMIRI